jgi:hypothetical protein
MTLTLYLSTLADNVRIIVQNATIFGQEALGSQELEDCQKVQEVKAYCSHITQLDEAQLGRPKAVSHVKATTEHSTRLIGPNTRIVWSDRHTHVLQHVCMCVCVYVCV